MVAATRISSCLAIFCMVAVAACGGDDGTTLPFADVATVADGVAGVDTASPAQDTNTTPSDPGVPPWLQDTGRDTGPADPGAADDADVDEPELPGASDADAGGDDGGVADDGGATDDGGDEGGTTDDGGGADTTDTGPGSEDFGELCVEGSDCESGQCIPGPGDTVAKVCTVFCGDEIGGCPEGYKCGAIAGLSTSICVPVRPGILCDPCDNHLDCNAAGDYCVTVGDGSYCGTDCSEDADACPAGYSCQDVNDPPESGNIIGRQCVRDDNICGCGVDQDFSADPDNCGSCGNVCAFDHAAPSCVGGACVMGACDAGFQDANGSDADGCEAGCTAAPDLPDLEGVDSDCDGVDGVAANSVFVDAVRGSDDGADRGTMTAPFATIAAALAHADANNRQHVLIADGTYEEKVTLRPGIGLYGGYRGLPGPGSPESAAWQRDIDSFETLITWNQPDSGNRVIALLARDITVPTQVQGLTARAASNTTTGGSSIAGAVVDCTDALVFERVTFIAGDAGPGADAPAATSTGTVGIGGSNGSDGKVQFAGFCSSDNPSGGAPGALSCSDLDVSGGRGGTSDCGDNPGQKGGDAPMSGEGFGRGGAGGAGASGGDGNAVAGDAGDSGRDGMRGVHGDPGDPLGLVDADGLWAPTAGGHGGAGAAGSGGGGGGGGGGDDCGLGGRSRWGGAGGGGGSGGCGGGPGAGGQSGGASLALYAHASSVGLRDCSHSRSSGGDGGDGAEGADGGAGGAGGTGGVKEDSDCGGDGGPGGAGGNGGQGGAGGGGAGGPSAGILISGEPTPSCDSLTFRALGTPGEGGASQGQSGRQGLGGDVVGGTCR